MFGKRSDGKELKKVDAVFRLIPNFMIERSDSQVFFNEDIPITEIDNYIIAKSEEGIKLTLLDIIFAAIVRILAERPRLNRFAANGRIYARNDICLCITIKKSLSDDAEESTLKAYFDGTENVFEVKDKLQNLIAANKGEASNSETDNTVNALSKIPTGILKSVVKFLKFLEKHNMLPKSLIKVSPFHASAYVTNVGSLGIESIYHHLYNFGTTSMFFAIGKKKKSYVFEDEDIKEERCVNVAFVGDERICDGYYYAHSFRTLDKYLRHPELLETGAVQRIKDPQL